MREVKVLDLSVVDQLPKVDEQKVDQMLKEALQGLDKKIIVNEEKN